MILEIQSIGLPPEQHADHVIAEMLHDLARKRAHLQDAVAEEFRNARDGNPRAQQKMAARMLAAGAAQVKLEPGKRGRYSLFFTSGLAGTRSATRRYAPAIQYLRNLGSLGT